MNYNCVKSDNFIFSQEKHLQFHLFIEDYVYNRGVPLSRIFNMDQTPMRVVFPAKKTVSPKGAKQVGEAPFFLPDQGCLVMSY